MYIIITIGWMGRLISWSNIYQVCLSYSIIFENFETKCRMIPVVVTGIYSNSISYLNFETKCRMIPVVVTGIYLRFFYSLILNE